MSERGLKRFIEELGKDAELRKAFEKAVAKVAGDAGFDVTAADVAATKLSQSTTAKKPETDFSKLKPVITSRALGEEDNKGKNDPNKEFSVTLAIGEEDKKPGDFVDEGPQLTSMALGEEGDIRPFTDAEGEDKYEPRATTCAMGEEDNKAKNDPNKEFSVTLAIGEEDKNKKPQPEEPTMTSMALGEEDEPERYPLTDGVGEEGNLPPRTTLKLGEEDKRKKPPSHPITTMAVGEEGKKPKPPSPK